MTESAGSSPGGLIGTLYIRMMADTADLDRKMDESDKSVTKHAEHMSHAAEGLKHVLGALGLAFGIHEIVHFVRETIEAADELKKFSSEVGIAVDKLAGFRFAADKANVGDNFQMGMRKFAMAMREAQVEGSAMQAVFRNLRVDPNQLPDAVFESAVNRFGQMEDGVNKLGLAQELFGTRNARFVRLLSQGTAGLKRDTEELAKVMGIGWEEAAEKSEAYHDAMVTLKAAFQGLAIVFVNEALPAMTQFAGKMAENLPTLQRYAKEIGTGLAFAIQTGLTALHGFMGAIKVVGIALLGLLEIQLRMDKFVAEKLSEAWEFWANAGIKAVNTVIGAFNSLPNWVKHALGFPAVNIKPMELVTLGKPSEDLDEWIDVLHDAREDLTNQLSQDFTETAKAVKEGNKEVADAIKEQAPNVEAIKERQDMLDKLVGKTGLAGARDFQKIRGGLRSDIAGMSGIEGLSEATKFREEAKDIESSLAAIQELRNQNFEMAKDQEERLTELERLYAEKRKAIHKAEVELRLHTFSKMSDDILTIGAAFAGKQTGLYKAMFATSKAFSIAEATMKIALGIAEAAGTPWPLNLFAIASVVAATASIVSSIQAVQLEFGGQREFGGDVQAGKAFMVGEAGPEMFVPRSGGSIIPNNRLGGGTAKVVINNYTDVKPEVSERQNGDERVIEIVLRRVKDELASDTQIGTGKFVSSLERAYQLRRR